MRRPALIAAVGLTLVVLAAGCGDDGGGGSPFVPESGDFGDGDIPNDVQDEVDEILDDLQSGDLTPEEILEDAQGTAEDFLESFGGSGSGTVEINGETIDFEAEICFAGQGDFVAEGLGSANDGTPVWVSISYDEQSREEVLEFMDESMVDTVYGDADPIVSQDLTVDFGRDEMFASAADDMPSFSAASTGISPGIEIAVNGSSASGSGEANDLNFVAGDFDDTFPFSFNASCG